MRRTNKKGVLIALVLLLITSVYGVFQARVLIEGPTLNVHSPTSGETVTGELLEVRGDTKNVTHVHVNGRPVLLDTKGTFSEKLATPEGYGVILVEAQNRFGHTIEEQIEFYGDPINETI
jgi:hypothetical protein